MIVVRRANSERGAGLVEYALLVVLISITAITAVVTAGHGVFDSVQNSELTVRAAFAGSWNNDPGDGGGE